MARIAVFAVACATLAGGGCTWMTNWKAKEQGSPVGITPVAGTGGGVSGGPPLIGPDAGGHTPQTELAPKDAAVACLAAAQDLDRGGKVTEAIYLYEKARGQDPKANAVATRRLAVLYDLAGDFDKASAEYATLIQANPKDAQLLNDLGYSHYSRGDWARAEQYLTQATALDPSLKRGWINLGLVLAATDRPDAALAAFTRAGTEAEARSNMGFALAAQGKTQEAVEQYRTALKLQPGLGVAQRGLDVLMNPPKPADKNVMQAGGKPRPATAEDVPTIFELEERIKKAEGATPEVR
jgi:tetratricopeptide (TPR) repeat protein